MQSLKLNSEKVLRLWGGSQAGLARKMGVSRQLLGYYLRSRALSAAPKLAKILGLDAKDLIK